MSLSVFVIFILNLVYITEKLREYVCDHCTLPEDSITAV